jgi:hypothetical protein
MNFPGDGTPDHGEQQAAIDGDPDRDHGIVNVWQEHAAERHLGINVVIL